MFIRMCMDLFNIGVEVWLAYWLFDVPGHRRFKQAWVRVLEYLLFFGLIGGLTLVNRLLFEVRFSNALNIIQIVIYFLLAVIFTTHGIYKCLTWPSIYFMSISVMELPGVMLNAWLSGQTFAESNYGKIIYDYIYLAVISAVLLVFVSIYRKRTKSKLTDFLIGKINLLLIITAFLEWWTIIYFLSVGFKEAGGYMFFYNLMFAGCSLLLMVIVVILSMYRNAEREMYLKELHDVTMDAEYAKIKSEYNNKSKEIHDLKHQINTLDGYLQEAHYEEAKAFLTEMSQELFDKNRRIRAWSGCPLIDMMLDSKEKKAASQGITMEIDVPPVENPLSERDMSILLGNILDNAIEAAGKTDRNQRKIYVKIYSKGNLFGISVENSLAQMPVIQDGRLISTKEDSEKHGWGMLSIQSIVTKYGGQIDYNYADQIFKINITFFS